VELGIAYEQAKNGVRAITWPTKIKGAAAIALSF